MKIFSGRASVRTTRKTRVVGALAAATSLAAAAWFAAPGGAAQAAVDPNDPNAHFVRVSTHGCPAWLVSGEGLDGSGNVFHRWKESYVWGGCGNYALWYWRVGDTAHPEGRVVIDVWAGSVARGNYKSRTFETSSLIENMCILVDAEEHIHGPTFSHGDGRYEGSECTPDSLGAQQCRRQVVDELLALRRFKCTCGICEINHWHGVYSSGWLVFGSK